MRVAAGGDDGAAASSGGATPFASIQAAIDFAEEHPSAARKVCVATGTFVAPLEMRNGISVYGGYASDTWSRSSGSERTALTTLAGISFGASVQTPTALDRFMLELEPSSSVALRVEGATGVELSSVGITCDGGVEACTCLEIEADSVVSATDVGIEVVALKTSVGVHAVDATLSFSNVSVTASVPRSEQDPDLVPRGRATGLRLEGPREVELASTTVSVFDSAGSGGPPPAQAGSELMGVALSGPGDIILIDASILVSGRRAAQAAGVVVDGLSTFALDGEVSVVADGPPSGAQSGPAASATGIRTGTTAAVEVQADVAVTTWDGDATGVACGGECDIHDGTVSISNSATVPGMDARSAAVSCTGATCVLTDNSITGPSGTTCYNSGEAPDCASTTRGARVVVTSSGLVARNRIDGGSASGSIGLEVAGPVRVENNFVRTANAGWPTDSFVTAVSASGAVDLHSNTVFAYTERPFFNQFAPCSAAGGVVVAGSPSIRNNVFGVRGAVDYCTSRTLFSEGCTSCTPAVFQNNAFYYDEERPLTAGFLYGNSGASVTTVDDVNALTDMQSGGNFASDLDCNFPLGSGSSCIDAGTPAAAPADDIDGEARTTTPDVGADEWSDACSEVTCSGGGHCAFLNSEPYCACDEGYENPPGNELDCVDIDECLVGNGGCDPLTECQNIPGGRSCGPCPDGLPGNGEDGCAPACDAEPCQHGGTCADLPQGQYQCVCAPGFSGSNCEVVFTQLSLANNNACGLRSDGTIACWGTYEVPGVADLSAPFQAVAAGEAHVCGLRTAGNIACFGSAEFGQSVPPPGDFASIASGPRHTCAISTAGELHCWGADLFGNPVVAPSGTFTQVGSSAGFRTCALRSDGAVVCFGTSFGNGSLPPAGPYAQVNSGFFESCGLRPDGTLGCWDYAFPTTLPPAGMFDAVGIGDFSGCAIRSSDGGLTCWGQNIFGEAVAPAGTFKNVAMGREFGCGITEDDAVVCWGNQPPVPPNN